MATALEMPKLGNTVEECLLAAWHKHTGDEVSAGDLIAEVETDKTSFELTAPVDGVLLGTFFEEGALVPVFTPICAIGAPGESAEMLRPRSAVQTPTTLRGATTNPVGAEPSSASILPDLPLSESGEDERTPRLSPRARRFAREHDFKPSLAEGTGPGGRLLEDDLRRAWHSRGEPLTSLTRQSEPAPQTEGGHSEPRPLAGVLGAGVPGVRMSAVRQRIAGRVRESLASTAQYTLHASANATGLLNVRKRMKASSSTEAVNINDLVTFLTVRALLEVPELNATFAENLLYRHDNINIGFACGTDRGLVVPVVRSAQDLSLPGLARRMKELSALASAGTISPDDLMGGTFTVSNLGALGIEAFTPVLNPPQVAILGVGAIGVKAARKPDGNLEFVDAIGLSLTLDHQVIDGAPGARFLAALRHQLEVAERLCTT